MRTRLYLATSVIGLLLLGASLAPAQKRTATSDRKEAAKAQNFRGKIVRVDATRRQLVVEVAVVTGEDGKKVSKKDRPGGGKAGDQWTFQLARNARITLDGKAAALRNIRGGQYALVRAVPTTLDPPDGRTGRPTQSAEPKRTADTNPMTALRIDVTSRPPASVRTGDKK
jgi:hypothetical protein